MYTWIHALIMRDGRQQKSRKLATQKIQHQTCRLLCGAASLDYEPMIPGLQIISSCYIWLCCSTASDLLHFFIMTTNLNNDPLLVAVCSCVSQSLFQRLRYHHHCSDGQTMARTRSVPRAFTCLKSCSQQLPNCKDFSKSTFPCSFQMTSCMTACMTSYSSTSSPRNPLKSLSPTITPKWKANEKKQLTFFSRVGQVCQFTCNILF